jgi:hypothetical protein
VPAPQKSRRGPGDRPLAPWIEHQDALVDALGNPVNFFLTGGEAHDLVGADHLLPSMQANTLIADKAFDAEERVIAPLAAAGKTAVIPPKANRWLPRARTRPGETSSPPSTSLPQSSGLIEDRP